MLRMLFSRKWLFTTLLVLAATAVMVRLGLWQLDRLEQRRALNARVQAQLEAPELNLNQAVQAKPANVLGLELYEMEYRAVRIVGVYDHEQEIALRNQTYNNRFGVHLFTPLKIAENDQTVLVDRGWISMDDFNTGDWSSFHEPGQVTVTGVIRRSRMRPDMGRNVDPAFVPGERLTSFSTANINRISEQLPYETLPVYIHQLPHKGLKQPPYRSELDIVLTEGSHLGYAVQWFLFAIILAVGYPFFVKRESADQRASKTASISYVQKAPPGGKDR